MNFIFLTEYSCRSAYNTEKSTLHQCAQHNRDTSNMENDTSVTSLWQEDQNQQDVKLMLAIIDD